MSKRHSNGSSNYNNGNAVAPPQSDTAILLRRQMMAINSILSERAALAGGLGQQFGGKRDIYNAAGYPKNLAFADYDNKYERQEMAGRIVRLPAQWTWREPPTIRDGDEDNTEFLRVWNELTGVSVDNIADQKSIWHYLERADKISGIGRFGLLYIGLSDKSGEPKDPITSGLTLDDFLYLQPIDEGCVQNIVFDNASDSPRYGQPLRYSVRLDTPHYHTSSDSGGKTGKTVDVHWSRVIHIADDLKSDDVYGKPRLKGVFNLLNSLEKVTAGAGEAAWQLMQKGYVTTTKDGYSLDPGTGTGSSTAEITTSEIESFVHGLSRFLELEGVDFSVLGGEMTDPSGLVKTIVSLISGETGIPQRLLLGNEQGQLASGQDERNWGNVIESRQKNFAEPIILRPLISRLVYTGILPKPTSGGYRVEWPDTFKLNEIEESERDGNMGMAMGRMVQDAKMPLETFMREFYGWSDDQIAAMYAAKEREENFAFRDTVTGIEQ